MIIGNINLPKPVLLAPMEDVTDISFRVVCKRLGADIVYTEFVNSEGLIRNSEKTKRKMDFLEEERPFGIQLYGGTECSMESAAAMAEELCPDLIDINCGCWVKNVVGQGAGSGLLKDLPKMKSVIESVARAVSVPVTVKTRLGWDEKTIRIIDVAKMVEDCGGKALTIHCRTRSQGNKGGVDYSWIPPVKQAVSIPIIVNGGIDSPQKAKEVFDTTGCDGIMIASAALANPWIFREIKQYLQTGELLPPASLEERKTLLLQHLHHSIGIKGEKLGIIEFRKYYSGYLHGFYGASKLRAELMQFLTEEQIIERLNKIPAESYHPPHHETEHHGN